MIASKYVVKLTAAIVQNIIKFILGIPALDSVTSAGIELAAGGFIDELQTRKIERKLEAAVEKLIENHISLFKRLSIDLSESEQLRIISILVDGLEKIKLTERVVTDFRLNSNNLAKEWHKQIKTTAEDTKILEITGRLIGELSPIIIKLQSRLQEVDLQFSSEVLSSLDKIENSIEKILLELKKHTHADLSNDELVKDYLKILKIENENIEIFGLPNHLKYEYDLDSAYTKMLYHNFIQNQNTMEEYDITQVLLKSNRLLITGSAGAGKTTLFQWLILDSIQKIQQGELRKIPLLLKLRHYSDDKIPSLSKIPTTLSNIDETFNLTWINDQAISGNIILLIDGLDEISKTKRKEFLTWLKTTTALYEAITIVISSREYVVNDFLNINKNYLTFKIAPLKQNQIKHLISGWFSANNSDDSIIKENSNDLFHKICLNRELSNLAENPLLCAMICTLYKHKNKDVPLDRIQLYEECIKLLIHQRETARKIYFAENHPELSERHKISIVSTIAFMFTMQGKTECHREDVLQRIENLKNQYNEIFNTSESSSILDFFIKRSALLKKSTFDMISFPHKTFQEYLTAKRIISEHLFETLLDKVDSDFWREVIILTCESCEMESKNEYIVKEILTKAKEDRNLYLYFLALSCAERALKIKAETKQNILKQISSFLPPNSTSEAKDLALAKNMVLPYMDSQIPLSKKQLNACIKTLFFIGTSEALHKLFQFLPRIKTTEKKLLETGWVYFDRKEYAKKILPGYTAIELNAETIDVQYLSLLPELTKLSIFNSKDVISLEALKKCNKLKYLYIKNAQMLNSIDFLNNLPQLEVLIIRNLGLSIDLSALSNLKKLRHLNLRKCAHIQGFNTFCMPTLEYFNISGTPIREVNLKDCVNLKCVDIKETQLLRKDIKSIINSTNAKIRVEADKIGKQLLRKFEDRFEIITNSANIP